MNRPTLSYSILFLAVTGLITAGLTQPPEPFRETLDPADIVVTVTVGAEPLADAWVALDLNGNGVWDEDLDEPSGWTDPDGWITFDDIVSITDSGPDGGSSAHADSRASRILTGNVRGTVGSAEVLLDFVVPPGSSDASLGFYDLRGRRLAQTRGSGDLTLDIPPGLPAGVYFARLGADPAAPVSLRITSAGARAQTIRAHRVSAAEAVDAGWIKSRTTDRQKAKDGGHPINVIVTHADHGTVIQPETVVPGINPYTVDMALAHPVLLESDPEDGADGADRNIAIKLRFSVAMALDTLPAHLSLRDADQNELPFSLGPGPDGWILIQPDEALPPEMESTLEVAAGAQAENGRALLGPAAVAFTTSDQLDTTPPTILQIEPPSGSIVADDLATFIITLSEPVDPDSFEPLEMGLELLWHVLGTEAAWSQNNTMLTMTLQTPLPAGVTLWTTFGGYADTNGVVQPDETTWSVTVAGTPDLYPVIDGRELQYWVSRIVGEIGDPEPIHHSSHVESFRYEVQRDVLFHLIEYDEHFLEAREEQVMQRTETQLVLITDIEHGDEGSHVTHYVPPVVFLQFPAQAGVTWPGEYGAEGEPSLVITAEGGWVEQLDRLAMNYGEGGPALYWTNVWVATVDYTFYFDDTLFVAGSETTYLAPGFGPVKILQEQANHIEGIWGQDEKQIMLPNMR